MRTLKEDNLHALIHSLKPNEKRFTKRYIREQKHVQKEYVLFFDFINKMKVYDKNELLTNAKSLRFDDHIEVKKHHLLQLILDSMRQYRNVNFKTQNNLIEIEILIEKGLFNLAHKRIKSQKKEASLSEDFSLLAKLLEKEIVLSGHIIEINSEELLKEIGVCYLKDENILSYRILLNNLFKLVEINSFVRNSKQMKRYERFTKNRLLINQSEAKSKIALILFYQFNYVYHASIGDQISAYNYARQFHKLVNSHHQAKGKLFNLVIRAAIARLSSLILKGYEPVEFFKLITEFKSIIETIKDPDLYINAMAKYYQFKLLALAREQRNNEALELAKEAIAFLRKNEVNSPNSYFIQYLKFDIAKTYFVTGNYFQANKWFLSIKIPKGNEEITDIYTFSRILSFFCESFQSETLNLRYNIAYFKKKLSKNGALFEFESFLLSRLNTKFSSWDNLTKLQRKALLKEFLIEIKSQLVNKWKSNTILYFDFEWWVGRLIDQHSS